MHFFVFEYGNRMHHICNREVVSQTKILDYED